MGQTQFFPLNRRVIPWRTGVAAPATLLPTANLVGRYEPPGMTQSGGAMTGWTDTSGLGNNITDIASAPSVVTALGLTVLRFTADRINLPASLSFNARAMSAYLVIRRNSLSSSQFVFGAGATTVASIGWASNEVNLNSGGNRFTSIRSGFNRALIGGRWNTSNIRAILDGELATLTVASAATQAGGAVGIFPSGNVGIYTGDVEAVFLYSAALSDPDLAQLRAYCVENYKVGAADLSNVYVMEGDSLTAGFGISDPAWNGWCPQWEFLHDSAPKWHHRAVTGQTIETMLAQAPTEIDVVIGQNPQFTDKTAVIWGGSNDVASDRSSSAILTDLQAWISGRITAGFTRLVVFTIPPSVQFTAPREAVRTTVNASIRANFGAWGADVLVDVAADPLLDDYSDLTYYQADGTHFNATGAGVVAALAFAAGL